MALFKKEKGITDKNDNGSAQPAWLITMTWVIAGLMVGLMGFSLYEYFSGRSLIAFINKPGQSNGNSAVSSLPDFGLRDRECYRILSDLHPRALG